MVKAKEIEGLNCDGSAAGEIRRVLSTRLEEMCALRAAALDWSDIEGVHDMRVASRRLRSALRDFKPYLRERPLGDVAVDLKRVADTLGAVRDQDVAIMALEELQTEAPEEISTGITELTDERRTERETARAVLTKTIGEEKLVRLRSDFGFALERATDLGRSHKRKKRTAAELSFSEAGREIILARLEELRDLSACLYRPFDTDALHEMRIAAKRLRYAMELFASCWSEALTEHAKEVAELQTLLGDLHDADVWLEGFGDMLRDFQKRQGVDDSASGGTSEQKRSAAVWLMRHFAKARMKHFGGALVRWHKWEAEDFFAQLITSLDARPRASVELSPVALTASEAVASDIEAREPSDSALSEA
ncbi:MAG TPA: CHAD domain-containing protein [Pyrinomonadaceae bacterium]|jgi:CHAD domain-containing protein